MASSNLNEPFNKCPTPFQHLLLRGVLTVATLWTRGKEFQRLVKPSDDFYSLILWSYTLHALEAMHTLGRPLQFSGLLTAGALLRVELECLISAQWVMKAMLSDRNRRAARIILKTLEELKRSSKDNPLHGHSISIAARGFLDTPELSPFKRERPAPSIRQMAEEAGIPRRYSEYRKWSSEMHAGFGMVIREGSGDTRLNRLEHLLLGAEYMFDLFEVLRETIPEAERSSFDAILGTFKLEYLAKFQDAYFSAHITTTLHDKDDATKTEGLISICRRLWQSDRPDTNPRMPQAVATEVVRGVWGKNFECVSVRFRNISSQPVRLRARLTEETRRRFRIWGKWRLSCEEVYFQPALALLPEQSGYLMFPGPVSKEKYIELDSGEPVGRVDVCHRPDAAMQNTEGHTSEIVTVRIDFNDAHPYKRVFQPIVVL